MVKLIIFMVGVIIILVRLFVLLLTHLINHTRSVERPGDGHETNLKSCFVKLGYKTCFEKKMLY